MRIFAQKLKKGREPRDTIYAIGDRAKDANMKNFSEEKINY
jgi:K+/H+ antiporter YhaU regulatory subunit KhtT